MHMYYCHLSSPHLQSMLSVGKISVKGLPIPFSSLRGQFYRDFNASFRVGLKPLHMRCASTPLTCKSAVCDSESTKSFVARTRNTSSAKPTVRHVQDISSQQKVSGKLFKNLKMQNIKSINFPALVLASTIPSFKTCANSLHKGCTSTFAKVFFYVDIE